MSTLIISSNLPRGPRPPEEFYRTCNTMFFKLLPTLVASLILAAPSMAQVDQTSNCPNSFAIYNFKQRTACTNQSANDPPKSAQSWPAKTVVQPTSSYQFPSPPLRQRSHHTNFFRSPPQTGRCSRLGSPSANTPLSSPLACNLTSG